METYYNIKHSAGYGGVKRLAEHVDNPEGWLSTQPTYTLHKPIKRKFPTRKYTTSAIDDLWQMDLMEMIPYARINKGNRYILTCIDVFSRFARAVALKSKEAIELRNAIKVMLKDTTPRHIQTDMGKEFYNKLVRELIQSKKIIHYSVYSQFKASLVERFNRTLREKFNRYFTHTGKKIWYNVLPDIINAYNNSKHRGIFSMKPAEVTKVNEMELWEKQQEVTGFLIKPTYKLLDYVLDGRSHF